MRELRHLEWTRYAPRDWWRRRLFCSVVALALGGSGIASAHSLEELLDLPIERLLQLRISPMTAAGRIAGDAAQLYPEHNL